MAYFPFFVELEGKECLVVGGGDVAFRKIRELLPFGVNITVVSLEICESICNLAGEYPGQMKLLYREYKKADLEQKFFVIAATDDEQCNREISEYCRQEKILVNVVDDKEKCSFYFPSLVKQKDIVAGFSSGGNSPALIKELRRELQGQIRPQVKKAFSTEQQRKQYYNQVIHKSRKESRALSVQEMEELIHKGFTQS